METASDSQWQILGYDPRHFAKQWKDAWHALFFDRASPLRQRLEEPVRLIRADDSIIVQGDRELAAGDAAARFEAYLVPDDIVLTQQLSLPLGVETEIDQVVAFELSARNPFPSDDVVTGWREIRRNATDIDIALVIASRSALASWAATRGDGDRDRELWVAVEDAYVALDGFGGSGSRDAYRAALRRLALKIVGVVGLTLLCLLLFVLYRHNEAQSLTRTLAAVEARAQRAMDLRNELAASNAVIAEASANFARQRSPHQELARLTSSLDDAAFITHFSMRGDEVRVRGQASDAAQVMQTLAEHPDYASVSAPQAITAVGRTNLEQFYLDLRLRPRADGEPAE